jgi:hypothetical protein
VKRRNELKFQVAAKEAAFRQQQMQTGMRRYSPVEAFRVDRDAIRTGRNQAIRRRGPKAQNIVNVPAPRLQEEPTARVLEIESYADAIERTSEFNSAPIFGAALLVGT